MIRNIFLLFLPLITQAQVLPLEKIDFRKADSLANLYKGENLKNLPVLAYQLTTPLQTDFEKFRALYTWVAENIDNDYDAYLKNKITREKLQGDSLALANWNVSFKEKMFKKLLKEQKTVCTGYAYLLRELAFFANINCEIINGYGRLPSINVGNLSIPNHSWNAVQLGGKWYLCDATWSSGTTYLPERIFFHEFNEGYFLTDPALFVKTHYPLDTAWILMNEKPSIQDFLNGPIVYGQAYLHRINPLTPNALKIRTSKDEVIVFSCSAPDSISTENITVELNTGVGKITPKVDITRNAEGLLELKYKFEKVGLFDFHIKLYEKPLVTYTIEVKKNKSKD